jgi:uncharacterized protein (TIGR03437 family)
MTPLPALASIPAPCLPNDELIFSSAYAAQVDGSSGNVLGSQFIGGSTLVPSGVALFRSTLWMAGATSLADFAQTPSHIVPLALGTAAPVPGAYLGAADFSQPQPPAGTPQIACIVDSANMAAMGPAAPNQLVTIFGTGLGPATGVSASNYTTTSLGGVNLSLGLVSAPLLYVSSTQINFAAPYTAYEGGLASMQLTVNAMNAPARAIPMTLANPSLFLNTSQPFNANLGFVALATNADGSLNSPGNPAQLGSAISVFVNGLSFPPFPGAPLQLSASSGWSIVDFVQANPFVLRVDLRLPAQAPETCPSPSSACTVGLTLFDINYIYTAAGPQSVNTSGQAIGGVVYVSPGS